MTMIELKTLGRKERVNVLTQCCSGFLAYSNTKAVQSIYSAIKGEFDLPKCTKEIKTLITLTGYAIRNLCGGSQLPMGARKFTSANRKTNQALNKTRMKLVVQKAEELGYITFYNGFKDVKQNISILSCFIIHDKFKIMYTETKLKSFKVGVNTNEVIEIKDEDGEVISKLTRFAGVAEQRRLMLNYNGCLSMSDIRIGVRKAFVAYKQVFSIDLDGAGRFYTFGCFQTMRSTDRVDITINGCETVEIDIVSNHLSIMYTLKGVKLFDNFDCYYVDIGDYEYADVRRLCKYAIMCMINCKTKSGSYGALYNILEQDYESDKELSVFGCDRGICKTVIDKLIEKHKRLTFFEKGTTLWRKLQRLDSKVCEGVIRHFTSKGIAVLCWHDSWRAAIQHQQELHQCIRDSWFKVFGTYDNCFLKVE